MDWVWENSLWHIILAKTWIHYHLKRHECSNNRFVIPVGNVLCKTYRTGLLSHIVPTLVMYCTTHWHCNRIVLVQGPKPRWQILLKLDWHKMLNDEILDIKPGGGFMFNSWKYTIERYGNHIQNDIIAKMPSGQSH